MTDEGGGVRAPAGRLDLPTGHHLRPVRLADLDRLLHAVTGSAERLAAYAGRGGWPDPGLRAEEQRDDLARREAMADGRVTLALFAAGETELVGGVVLTPGSGWHDLWVVDGLLGGPVEDAVRRALDAWPAQAPRTSMSTASAASPAAPPPSPRVTDPTA